MGNIDNHRESGGTDRGRAAETPQDIPKRGWKDVLKRTKDELAEDHISIVAGGISFFVLLGIVPGIAALISIYGLVADPAEIQQQFAALKGVIPGQAYQLLSDQMEAIASAETAAGWGAAIGIILALWGGSKAMKALMDGLNVTYDEQEKRGFLRLNVTAVALTLVAVIAIIFLVALIAGVPALMHLAALDEFGKTLVNVLRWPVMLVCFVVGLSLLYRFGPSRDEPKWRWVSVGAVVATLVWLIASILFSLYVSNFESYNKTYGSLGTVVILLMWFYISGYAVLLGAELNTEIERQTTRDTTKGAPQPQGHRGAYAADNLGEAQA